MTNAQQLESYRPFVRQDYAKSQTHVWDHGLHGKTTYTPRATTLPMILRVQHRHECLLPDLIRITYLQTIPDIFENFLNTFDLISGKGQISDKNFWHSGET